jgi:hypothetical protein
MTGFPQFNVPLFDTVASALREQGWTIVSPAELDSEEVRAVALASPDGKLSPEGLIAGETWGDMLARDVKLLADGVEVPTGEMIGVFEGEPVKIRQPIDGIVLLPGWQNSRGARLEAFVGLLTGKAYFQWLVYPAEEPKFGELYARDPRWVEHMLANTWAGPALYRPL